MKLYDISKGNILRRPGRAVAVVFGLMVAVLAMTALFSITTGLAHTVEKEMAAAGTKVLILPRSEKASFSYGGIAVAAGVTYNLQPLPKNIVSKITDVVAPEKIVAVSPVNLSSTTIGDKKYLTVGQDFSVIAKTKPWWKVNGRYPAVGDEILLGNNIAEKLGAKFGHQIQTLQGKMTVTGILDETGAQDDGIIFTINNKETAPALVEMLLRDDESFNKEVSTLQQALPFAKISPVRDAAQAKKESFNQYRRFSIVIAAIMALVAMLIVTTGFSAAATERAKEVGIFRAMGFHIKHIVLIFLYEALILAGIGSIIGLAIGQSLALLLAQKVAGGSAAFLPWYAYVGVVVGSLVLAGLAAYYPAKKAAMVDPVEALRYL